MQISIIGCGNMGSALAQRLSKSNRLFLYDHNIDKTDLLAQKGYGKSCKDIKDAIQSAEIVLVAVKPQNLQQIASAIKKNLKKDQLIISILAGISLESLNQYFPKNKIVRMMPNLALIVGEGVIGLSAEEKTEKELQKTLTTLLLPLGKVSWIPEEKMNALAALTGSGPAFVFTIFESMVDAGIAMGFSAKNSQELVLQMLKGSLSLLENSKMHPGELRWQITSPQGTTIAGIKQLEELALRGTIINTFLATYNQGNMLLK